jgi:hypothetical protein
MAEDPLLSPLQVARMYGTGIATVVELIEEGSLATLDDGRLVSAGKLEIPLIRESWARALQQPSPGSARVLRPPEGRLLHPAMEVAADFLTALQSNDGTTARAITSSKSRQGMNDQEVLASWLLLVGGKPDEAAGIGSAVYSLAPFPAVAVRILAHTPKFPRAVDRPTPARLIAALPLIEESEGWRLDLTLMKETDKWFPLLYEPPPESASSEEG